jgi:hypothetical protein
MPRELYDERRLLHELRRRLSPYIYRSGSDRAAARRLFTVGVAIQEAILDHGGEGLVIRVLRFDDVAVYEVFREDGHLKVEGPSRSEVERKVRDRYGTVVSKSQRALLPTLYGRLVRIPEVSLSMNPLRKILIFLEETGVASPQAIRRPGQKLARVRRYFSLLEDLGYIAKENGGYVPGRGFADLKAGAVEPPALYEHILGDVIRRRSKYLQEVLHWTMMVPFLRWSNAYYLPAYEAGHLLRTERDELVTTYSRYYGYKRRQAEVITQLQRTVDAGALKREKPYYLGDESILASYSKRADEEKVLQPAVGIEES